MPPAPACTPASAHVAASAAGRQKKTMPPKAKPFIRACSPAAGLDVVRLTSPTSVKLFVSP
jgi:hypothetical protein